MKEIKGTEGMKGTGNNIFTCDEYLRRQKLALKQIAEAKFKSHAELKKKYSIK
jgi:hypothetical protein